MKEALRMALELLAVATYHSPDLQAKRTEVIEQGLKALAQPTPPSECQTEAEKIAFAHGWWKALETKAQPPYRAVKTYAGGKPNYVTQQEPVEGMVLVPYEPCFEMQEQGSTASNYDLSLSRAKRVYQAMIDMHHVLEEKEPSDEWFQLNAGYTSPPHRTWQGLTDEEAVECWPGLAMYADCALFWKNIEAKLKAKNT